MRVDICHRDVTIWFSDSLDQDRWNPNSRRASLRMAILRSLWSVRADPRQYSSATSEWPVRSRHTASRLIQRYGAPHEASSQTLVWYQNRPWEKTIAHAKGVRHDFPFSHIDLVEQTVRYHVPYDEYDELNEFCGSIIIDRTRGLLTSFCDSEETNTLMLNLAHDIVIGLRTPHEAREFCIHASGIFHGSWYGDYREKLRFVPMSPSDVEFDAADPDKRKG